MFANFVHVFQTMLRSRLENISKTFKNSSGHVDLSFHNTIEKVSLLDRKLFVQSPKLFMK